MKEQLFCAKCGKVNWSSHFQTCECAEPEFKYETYDDYLKSKKSEDPE